MATGRKIEQLYELDQETIFGPSALTNALRSIRNIELAYEHRVAIQPQQYVVKETDGVFKVEPIEVNSKELDLMAASIESDLDMIAKIYGVPRQIVDLKRTVSYRQPSAFVAEMLREEHKMMLDSFVYGMQNQLSDLDVSLMYGTWDVDDEPEEWTEEYIEGQDYKTKPL
jgi:hypothetical protein